MTNNQIALLMIGVSVLCVMIIFIFIFFMVMMTPSQKVKTNYEITHIPYVPKRSMCEILADPPTLSGKTQSEVHQEILSLNDEIIDNLKARIVELQNELDAIAEKKAADKKKADEDFQAALRGANQALDESRKYWNFHEKILVNEGCRSYSDTICLLRKRGVTCKWCDQ
jgi:hypothetical protein